MKHLMWDDPCHRRATFGMTIENTMTRLWFCCRSSVVVSEPFDFLSVRAFIFTFGSIFIHPTSIRTRKRSLSSLRPSRSSIERHSASILQLYASQEGRRYLSLMCMTLSTKRNQGSFIPKRSYLRMERNGFEVEALACTKPLNWTNVVKRKVLLLC